MLNNYKEIRGRKKRNKFQKNKITNNAFFNKRKSIFNNK